MIVVIVFLDNLLGDFMHNFFNKSVAIVTGAASGIGLATARLLIERNVSVVAVDLNWSKEVMDLLPNALILTEDLSTEKGCMSAVEEAKNKFKTIDILINCAGITYRKNVIDTSLAEWDEVMNINLRSVYLMSRQALKVMIPHKKGSIVNIASGWGLVGGKYAAAYCASKGGVVLLTKAMALDHGPDGIRINCICPGDTDTPMLKHEAIALGLKENDLLEAAKSRPLGRAAHPEEIAESILFLASPSSSFTTGTTLIVDGGSLAGSP